ncbi:MAG: winged helix-turn-helix transcriptional regulator [Chthoniobacterales bacterium]|nr:winged helix-turn-helix transcriptional regulator [Chthoniobacterales bacterium]
MGNRAKRAKMDEEVLEMIAGRFRVLGEATRLKLMIALEDGEKNVSSLVKITGRTQTNVSRQLQILTDAGLLARRKEGLNVIYRIADKSIFEMCDHVCGSLQRRLDAQADTLRPIGENRDWAHGKIPKPTTQ